MMGPAASVERVATAVAAIDVIADAAPTISRAGAGVSSKNEKRMKNYYSF